MIITKSREKEVISLKERLVGCIGGFGRRNTKRILVYNSKTKIHFKRYKTVSSE